MRFTRREHVYAFNEQRLVYDDTFADKLVPVEEDAKMVARLPIHVYTPEDPSLGSAKVLVNLPPESSLEDGVFERCSDPFFS